MDRVVENFLSNVICKQRKTLILRDFFLRKQILRESLTTQEIPAILFLWELFSYEDSRRNPP